MSDLIKHPRHYTRGKIEVWDFIVDQGLNYLLGNVCKYICRAGHKGDRLEDLKKARAYLDREIKREEALRTENDKQLELQLEPFKVPYPSSAGDPFLDRFTTDCTGRKLGD
jgi:uncharacterized protein DUF3310